MLCVENFYNAVSLRINREDVKWMADQNRWIEVATKPILKVTSHREKCVRTRSSGHYILQTCSLAEEVDSPLLTVQSFNSGVEI